MILVVISVIAVAVFYSVLSSSLGCYFHKTRNYSEILLLTFLLTYLLTYQPVSVLMFAFVEVGIWKIS